MSAEKVNIAPASEETLKAIDWIIVIDHSGSTSNSSRRLKGKTLYDEMQEQCQLAANVASKYDTDGITLIHFSNHVKVTDGVTGEAVADLFRETQPGGGTMMAPALQKAIDKAKSTTKQTVVIVFTDGEANDPEDVIQVMNAAGKELGRPRIGFAFIQVGSDPAAKRFLDRLDNEMAVDVCATFSEEDAEGLTIPQLVNAAFTE